MTAVAFVAMPAGAQWIRDSSIPAGEVLDLEIADQSLFVASLDSIYRRSEGQEAFTGVGSLGEDIDFWSLSYLGDRLLAGTFGDGIYESIDGGMSWTARNSGLIGSSARTVSCIARRGDSVYIGTDGSGVYVSPLQTPIIWQPFRDSLLPDVAWTAYALHQWNGMLFTGAGQNAHVHRNLPDRDYWESFQFGDFIQTGLAMISIGHSEPGTLIGAGLNGIYNSIDSGVTWTYFPAPFNAAGDGSVFSAGARTFAMLTQLSQGMYVWELKNGTWELFDHQPMLRAYDVVYFDGRLYAG
jgi:hypothetical protein